MSRIKKITIGFILVFTGIQFFQPARNDDGQVTENHIERMYPVPENIKALLSKACYDCHSNQTRYPWYSSLQPGAWFMNKHITEGKEKLNFSEFGNYSSRRQHSKFVSMSNQVRDGLMPIASYTLIHRDALLSGEEKERLLRWLNERAASTDRSTINKH